MRDTENVMENTCIHGYVDTGIGRLLEGRTYPRVVLACINYGPEKVERAFGDGGLVDPRHELSAKQLKFAELQ